MKQFTVCRIRSGRGGRPGRLVVVLQHDQLGDLKTRIVAPLLDLSEAAPVEKLAPKVIFAETPYRISFHKMATIDSRDLETVGTIQLGDLLMHAIDLIFAGV